MKKILFSPWGYSILTVGFKDIFTNTIFVNFGLTIFVFLQSGMHFFDFGFLYFVHLILYMLFYEIGYIINNHISVRFEKNPTHRIEPLSIKLVTLSILYRFIIGFFLIYIFFDFLRLETLWLLLFSFIIFLIHNFILEFYRVITFFFLRILKGLFPVIFGFYLINESAQVLVFIGLLIVSTITTIPYSLKKIGTIKMYYTAKQELIYFLLFTIFSLIFLLSIYKNQFDILTFSYCFIGNYLCYFILRTLKNN